MSPWCQTAHEALFTKAPLKDQIFTKGTNYQQDNNSFQLSQTETLSLQISLDTFSGLKDMRLWYLVLTLSPQIYTIIPLGKEKANLICNKFIICHKYGCQPQLDGWADPVSLSGTWLQISHPIWSPLPWSITAVVSRNAHLASEGLTGRRRGTKIRSWRDGNGYLTKLHIRTNHFQRWRAFQWCLRDMKPLMGSTQQKFFWLGGVLVVCWGF